MLGLREIKQTEADVIKAVKTAIETCDAEELKSKKFVGLLNDFIKDQSGLKIRLELLGKSGMIPLIDKTLKEANPTLKIEKMAQQFSKNYGFTQDVTAKTFEILTLALSNKKTSAPVTLKIVEPVQVAQGGFSKKHFNQPIVEKSVVNANRQATIKVQQPNEGSGKRKKWVRNTFNLWSYILLLVTIPFGYIGLNAYYDKLLDLETVFVTRFHPHFYVETSFVVAASLMIFAIFSPYLINWTTKKNTLSFYPLAALFFQVITFQLASTDLSYYMDLQMLFGIGTLISFAVLGFYAMRLPKGAYDYTAYRSIGPYYLITCIWMVGQYIVYSKAFGI
jgi:hypothetical protein